MSAARRVRIVLRLPGGRSTLSLFVAGSIAVHVILAIVLILLPLGRRRAAAANDSMVVELAGPMPGPPSPAVGAPTPPAPPAPRAEPQAPKEAPKPEPKGPSLVEPKEKEKEKKDKEKKKPDSEPAAVKPPPAPDPPPSPGGPGATPTPGAGGIVGGGGSGAADGSSELAWYWGSVTAALRSHWVRPVLEGAGGILTVTITFEVRRDGTVANAAVETGSGVPSLDRSALRAVADASPLPPLPSSAKEASLVARYQFELTPGE